MGRVLLAQLEGFVAVAGRGSVSRAAEDLGITQPALTARLRSLEREFGLVLLARTARGVRLTDAGRAFLPYAERMAASAAQASQAMARLRAGSGGSLEIGAAPSVGTYVLPRVLRRFRALHPDVQLSVRTGHSEEVLEMVLREQVQLGIVRALRHPRIESTPLYEDELALVVHPQHRLAREEAVRVDELAEQQLILFDRASSFHDLTNAFIRQAGVRPGGVMELDNIEAAKKMVEHGLGLALVPRRAVADELSAGLLRAVRIADAAPLRRLIVAIRLADAEELSPTLGGFLSTLAEMTRDGQPAPSLGLPS
jgi:DNA-binding transcriptional LysR family regulator